MPLVRNLETLKWDYDPEAAKKPGSPTPIVLNIRGGRLPSTIEWGE